MTPEDFLLFLLDEKLSGMPFLVARDSGKGNIDFSFFLVESGKIKTGLGKVVKPPNMAVCHKNFIKNTEDAKYLIMGMARSITNQNRGQRPGKAG